MIDLNPKYLETIQHVLSLHIPEYEVRVFGSRVKWTAKGYSDLDLAVVGSEPLTLRQLRQLAEAFEESYLPIRVDVVDWQSLSDGFRKVISEKYEVIQEGAIVRESNEWQIKAFGDCATLVRESVSPSDLDDTPYIGLEHIGENTLSLVGHDVASSVTSTKSRFKRGDILFGKLRCYFRKVVRAPFDGICSTDIWVTRAKEGVDQEFLYYCMASQSFIDFADSGSEGTRMPRTTWEWVSQYKIPLPALSEQRRIAHLLGTLDEKIELNRQMNETLEAMARAIFKSWFVDFDPVQAKIKERQPAGMDAETAALFPSTFQDSPLGKIPEEWEVARFADLADVILGGDWGKETESDNYLHPTLCIRGADISSLQTGGLGDMPIRYLKTSSLAKRQLRSGDLVIEISGGSPTQSTGRAMLINKELLDRLNFPLVYSNFCRLIRLKPEDMSNFVYLWFRRLYSNDEFFQYENGTTGIKNLAFMVFAQENNILVPPMPIVNAFNRKIEPLFTMLQLNGEQSRTLSQIRDTLLPKLLSGKIRVDDVDKGLEVKDGGTS